MLDVLVVDDSDLIRTMILRTLKMAQVPVGVSYEAGNGREALEILEDNWVDLVLADINMPVMDGLEMVGRMKRSQDMAGIPVIIVSTEASTSRLRELEDIGIAAYVRKPFTPEKLRDVVVAVTSDWTQPEHEGLVADVLQKVLEQFVFMYGEPMPSDLLPDPGEGLLLARMTFSGGQGGAMALAAGEDLCREMAANILGEELPRMRESAADAIGEVLNMACGHVTTALEGEAAIDLAPPVVSRISREEWDSMAANTRTCAFNVEGRPVLLSLGLRS